MRRQRVRTPGLELTASSVRSCPAVRRDSSNRIPENRVGNRRNVPKVRRLTGSRNRQKGPEDGGKAGGAEKAQTSQTCKTCMAWVKSGLIEAQFPVGPHETHRQSARRRCMPLRVTGARSHPPPRAAQGETNPHNGTNGPPTPCYDVREE